MLAKCTNPQCSSPFRYLGEGRLFRRDNEEVPVGFARTRPEYFWLCGSCSKVMTLRINEHGEVLPVAAHTTIHGLSNAIDITIREQKYRISLHSVALAVPNGRMKRIETRHATTGAITPGLPRQAQEIYSH